MTTPRKNRKSTVPLTAERARELVDYDPETGLMRRRFGWSGKRAGAIAGCLDHSSGYWKIALDCRQYRLHRVAWLIAHGEWPTGLIDHINGDTADNRIANLRLAMPWQNSANMKRHADNKSGFKGVSWHKGGRRWRAAIRHEGREYHLGHFLTKEEAAAAYAKAARDLKGDFARTD